MPAARRDELAANLARVQRRLAAASAAAGRQRSEITLVAVSKTWPAEDVGALAGLGVTDFGENRDREAAAKAAAVPAVRWHFVGQLQTNKAASVASYADVVHSVDRGRLARALGRAAGERTIEVFVQVRLDDDPQRGGVPPAGVPALADLVAATPGLRLLGVMAIAPPGEDPAAAFDRLAQAAARLRAAHPGAAAISAGMSGDVEQALRFGATHVRIGTALFGGRRPSLG